MKKLAALALLGTLALSSCCSVDAEYLASFRDAVKAEHLRYVLQDESLDVDAKARRDRTWQVFEAYLKSAGGNR